MTLELGLFDLARPAPVGIDAVAGLASGSTMVAKDTGALVAAGGGGMVGICVGAEAFDPGSAAGKLGSLLLDG